MMNIATAQLWVHDQDEALKYWTAATSPSQRWATFAGSP